MWTYPLGGDTVHLVQDGLAKMFVTDSVGLSNDAPVVASLFSVSYDRHVPFVSMIYFHNGCILLWYGLEPQESMFRFE